VSAKLNLSLDNVVWCLTIVKYSLDNEGNGKGFLISYAHIRFSGYKADSKQ